MSELELEHPLLKDIEVNACNPLCQWTTDPNDSNKANIPNHVDFVGQSREKKLTFRKNVTVQLHICQLCSEGFNTERVEKL